MKMHFFWIALIATLSSCRIFVDEPSQALAVRVVSLRENYPIIFSEAKQWDDNAYLHSAYLSLDNDQWDIMASFQSPSRQNESILLTVFSDQSIKTEIVVHSGSVVQQQPILEDDWIIDSPTAVEKIVALNSDVTRFLTSHPNHCSTLKLERFLPKEKQPVVWSLALFDCKMESRYFYIDPMTGEILSFIR